MRTLRSVAAPDAGFAAHRGVRCSADRVCHSLAVRLTMRSLRSLRRLLRYEIERNGLISAGAAAWVLWRAHRRHMRYVREFGLQSALSFGTPIGWNDLVKDWIEEGR